MGWDLVFQSFACQLIIRNYPCFTQVCPNAVSGAVVGYQERTLTLPCRDNKRNVGVFASQCDDVKASTAVSMLNRITEEFVCISE